MKVKNPLYKRLILFFYLIVFGFEVVCILHSTEIDPSSSRWLQCSQGHAISKPLHQWKYLLKSAFWQIENCSPSVSDLPVLWPLCKIDEALPYGVFHRSGTKKYCTAFEIFRYLLRAANVKDKFLIEEEALTSMVSLLLNLQEQSPDVITVRHLALHAMALKNTNAC